MYNQRIFISANSSSSNDKIPNISVMAYPIVTYSVPRDWILTSTHSWTKMWVGSWDRKKSTKQPLSGFSE